MEKGKRKKSPFLDLHASILCTALVGQGENLFRISELKFASADPNC